MNEPMPMPPTPEEEKPIFELKPSGRAYLGLILWGFVLLPVFLIGVLLFFKKLCPHCKNMEKVLEKFGAAKPGIALYGIDIEENAAAAAALGAERPPTIFVIKGGEVKASKVGLMNPREMAAFFEKA